MSDQSHSPEPWAPCNKWGGDSIVDGEGSEIVWTCNYDGAVTFSPDDQRRIVACVNFLRGVSTDVLESLGKTHKLAVDQNGMPAAILRPIGGDERIAVNP